MSRTLRILPLLFLGVFGFAFHTFAASPQAVDFGFGSGGVFPAYGDYNYTTWSMYSGDVSADVIAHTCMGYGIVSNGSANPGTDTTSSTFFNYGGPYAAGTYTLTVHNNDFCDGGYGHARYQDYYQVVYWNGTSIVPPTVDPISDYNEVVRYWPSSNYATSTGTTTIGVQFSIAHPEWIDGVGFELSGTTDTSGSSTIAYTNKLYEASTTVATAQVFSLTTPYNFAQAGYYSITAYFIQGGRKVYNNSNATILVNYVPPNITIGSDGQFHFNGTTTVATSTLDALHIDCGDTFIVSSICKLAVSFVVPDPSAVQGIKDSWNSLLTKAPFSFFTESKNILGGFAGTPAGTGGSLSLNLYGQNAPIVSTTTASNVGFGSTPINVLKTITAAALWIFLLWFIYWRTAGILAKIERV